MSDPELVLFPIDVAQLCISSEQDFDRLPMEGYPDEDQPQILTAGAGE